MLVTGGHSRLGANDRGSFSRGVTQDRDFGPAGILVRADRAKIPRKRPDKTVRPRDFGPGTEVLV